MNSFTLTAIPLFILIAEILQEGKLSQRVYRGLSTLVAWMPGGLLQTNIAGCAIFAAISGSSVVTAASIGRVALPELQRRNYSPRLSAGSLAAGGTLGILFPPSIAMIVYGTFTETSVAKLFMAGVMPGLLLTFMFMSYIAVHAWLKSGVAPVECGARSLGADLAADRHQPVRHSKHLDRQVERRCDGDRSVPSPAVRVARLAGRLSRHCDVVAVADDGGSVSAASRRQDLRLVAA
jgi:tripartite ATP-independent transporter DctM subunit